MSYQAVSWAYDDAPTLLMPGSRKPDTTAHAVLVALAETAGDDGRGARPSVLRLQHRTRFDERTVQNALKRLEVGQLIKRTGIDRFGVVCWDLDMSRVRPAAEWDDLQAARDEKRRAESVARMARRDRPTSAVSGTQNTGHIEGDVAPNDLVRSFKDGRPVFKEPASGLLKTAVRSFTPPEPPVNHPSTITTTIPGGAPPPDPRRTEPPTATRTDSDSHSTTIHGDQSLPSDHSLGDDPANDAPADEPEAEVIDLAARRAELAPARCADHGLKGGNRPDGQPHCPLCRTQARIAAAMIPSPRGAPA